MSRAAQERQVLTVQASMLYKQHPHSEAKKCFLATGWRLLDANPCQLFPHPLLIGTRYYLRLVSQFPLAASVSLT